MYGYPSQSASRFVWILDEEATPLTEVDKELWRRYIALRHDIETTLEGLDTMRNWLTAKLAEVHVKEDDAVTVFSWELEDVLSELESIGSRLRGLPAKHLIE